MNTEHNDYSYQVPSFGKPEVYNFAGSQDNLDIYKELSQISEEIEQCRLRNC